MNIRRTLSVEEREMFISHIWMSGLGREYLEKLSDDRLEDLYYKRIVDRGKE